MDLLLSYGADTDVKNVEGQKPQDVIPRKLTSITQQFAQPRPIAKRKYIPKIPRAPPVCLKDKVETCEDFTVYVRYYWRGRGVSWATSTSVSQLVYKGESELKDIETDFKKHCLEPNSGEGERLDDMDVWRWIHFPANNASGC